jgi:DnaJ-class molecular chaperone
VGGGSTSIVLESQGRAGDLYVTAQIKAPKRLSDRKREFFESLREASAFDPRQSV